jgi:hypothetical protein
MSKFRLVFTIIFFAAVIAVVAFFAIMDKSLFFLAGELVKNNVIAAAILLFVFIVLITIGIIVNVSRGRASLFRNGYFQLAILELFLLTAGLTWFRFYLQQPGTIVLKISPGDVKDYITVGLTYTSHADAQIDTISAPGELTYRAAGTYRIATLDPTIKYYEKEIMLEPGSTQTVTIPVELEAYPLIVASEPTDAEIWIDGIHAANTPHTFNIVNRDTIFMTLKKAGYQNHEDTVLLDQPVDLGIIPLARLQVLRIICAYPEYDYHILDSASTVVFSGKGSRRLELPAGRYRLAHEIGEGQFEYRSINLTTSRTLNVP